MQRSAKRAVTTTSVDIDRAFVTRCHVHEYGLDSIDCHLHNFLFHTASASSVWSCSMMIQRSPKRGAIISSVATGNVCKVRISSVPFGPSRFMQEVIYRPCTHVDESSPVFKAMFPTDMAEAQPGSRSVFLLFAHRTYVFLFTSRRSR